MVEVGEFEVENIVFGEMLNYIFKRIWDMSDGLI